MITKYDANCMMKNKELVKAWLDGAGIQYNHNGEWKDCLDESIGWFHDVEYRIKPKIVKMWFWVYKLEDTDRPYISMYRFSEQQVEKFPLWKDKTKIEWTEIEIEG